MSWRVRAGLLMFRFRGADLEVFLAHRGEPPDGVPRGDWLLPKGGLKQHETLLQAAKREFEEEVGIHPQGPFVDLGSIQQTNGKIVHIWAFLGEWDDSRPIKSQMREVIWPPGSAYLKEVPEFERAKFFRLEDARLHLDRRYVPLLDRLTSALGMQKDATKR